MMLIIYRCINIQNGLIYIGKTKRSLFSRKSAHIYHALKRNSGSKFHQAIRDFGRNNFEWQTIKKVNSKEDADFVEMEEIAKYEDKFLYNETIGGDTSGKSAHKLSMIEKNALSQGARPFNVYKAIFLGRKNKVYFYKKGEFIGKWLVKNQCVRDLKVSKRHLHQCLKGERKTHKGYIFEWI